MRIITMTHEDANYLCGYILGETGYSKAKFIRILGDYCEKILKHGPNLPTRTLVKLRDKWGLSVHVGGAVWALAAATVGALHVRLIIHEDTKQIEILAE